MCWAWNHKFSMCHPATRAECFLEVFPWGVWMSLSNSLYKTIISPVTLTENSKTDRQEILDVSWKTFVKSHARGLEPKMPTEDMSDMKHRLAVICTPDFIIILQKGGASTVARMYRACVRACQHSWHVFTPISIKSLHFLFVFMVTELLKQSATVSRVGPRVECAHMEAVGYCSLPQRGTQDDSFWCCYRHIDIPVCCDFFSKLKYLNT